MGSGEDDAGSFPVDPDECTRAGHSLEAAAGAAGARRAVRSYDDVAQLACLPGDPCHGAAADEGRGRDTGAEDDNEGIVEVRRCAPHGLARDVHIMTDPDR